MGVAANDDGSGTALVMEFARSLPSSDVRTARSVRFALWDHGNPVTFNQALDADVDIEFRLPSEKADESAALALELLNANRMLATGYPAVMSNTGSGPFQDPVAAASLRENRRLYETGIRANPHWHPPTDLFVTFSEADFGLGCNAAQTTLAAVARLVDARTVEGR